MASDRAPFPDDFREAAAQAEPVQRPLYSIFGISSGLLTSIGFFGLWVCKITRQSLAMSEREFMATPVGSVVVWTWGACFMVGLFVLHPVALYLQRRAGGPYPGWQGWTVPGWIAWPFRLVMYSLLLLIAVGVTSLFLFDR